MPSNFYFSMRGAATFVMLICETHVGAAEGLRLDDMKQTRERPLFSISRRPPEKEAPAIIPLAHQAAPAPIEPPSLTLLGVAMGPQESEVIVQKSGAAKALRVVLGEEIDGWRVASIESRLVVLKQGDHSTTLTFPSASGSVTFKASP